MRGSDLRRRCWWCCFRLKLQGFALGGEVGPTTAYMAEAAPPERRGFYISMQYATQDCSTLVAGLIGLALSQTLSETQLQDWGWRAAMLVGAAIVPFGLWLRSSLPETLHAAGEARAVPLEIGTCQVRMRATVSGPISASPCSVS